MNETRGAVRPGRRQRRHLRHQRLIYANAGAGPAAMVIAIPDVRPCGIDPYGLGTLPPTPYALLIPSGPKLRG